MRLQQVHGIYSYFIFAAASMLPAVDPVWEVPSVQHFPQWKAPCWTSRTRWWQFVTHWKDQYCECIRDESLHAFERDILKRSYMFFYSFQTKSRPTTYPLYLQTSDQTYFHASIPLYQNIHLPYHTMLQQKIE